jgi:tetratricopeptide (TPR) repeat protein
MGVLNNHISRLFGLAIALILTSLIAPVCASEPVPFLCEQYVLFLDPDSSFLKERITEDLKSWCLKEKQIFNDGFCKLLKTAPNLVKRACNGDKLKVVLFRHDDPSTAMECIEDILILYPRSLKCDQKFQVYCLAHELVHAIDAYHYLSDSPEWNRLISPYQDLYCAKYPERFLNYDPVAAKLGLPSSYAATNPTEALAECASHMAVNGWKPPRKIGLFVTQRILPKPDAIDPEVKLLRQANSEPDKKKRIALFTEVLKIDPDCVRAWMELADIWSQYGELELSRFHVSRALWLLNRNGAHRYNHDMSSCYNDLGVDYVQLNQYSRAIDLYEKAIWMDPWNEFPYHNLGMAYYDLKKYPEAANRFSQALFLDSSDCLAEGYLDDSLGRHREAIRKANKALAEGFQAERVYNLRGCANESLGKMDIAIAEFSKAIELEPNLSVLYENRAAAFEKAGKTELAKRDRLVARTKSRI